ncbi:MAG: flagellar biosynthesis protein FlhF [Clostridiales bacterium]|jgi:flagellar biosynthesis protein FlhF|nr:flagellar biosynthesis protein FlhF [Clostridiales bacterium]
MKMKKYEARTEQEAIEKVKNDLGLDALILNIKKVQPRGIFSALRKPHVELVAAYEEKTFEEPDITDTAQAPPALQQAASVQRAAPIAAIPRAPSSRRTTTGVGAASAQQQTASSQQVTPFPEAVPDPRAAPLMTEPPLTSEEAIILEQKSTIEALEQKLDVSEELITQLMARLSASQADSERKYENEMVQFFYDTLVGQGVTVAIAEKLLADVAMFDKKDVDMDVIVKIVYNNIYNILKDPPALSTKRSRRGKPQIAAFIGPTGVGKTTTIAKLSSEIVFKHKLRLGLITADTYRIAAVEQLKTYAQILGLDVGVAYDAEDLRANLDRMINVKDAIFIDTAGRSHRNEENLRELQELLDKIPECQRILVLSSTTKYEDLLSIVDTYLKITDFYIIFTKLDETECLGTILNICFLTGKKVAYIATGQNVPDDFEKVEPDKMTKALMGLGVGGAY